MTSSALPLRLRLFITAAGEVVAVEPVEVSELDAFALPALEAVETAMVVINAATGVEPMAQRMMQHAAERGLDRMVIVNNIDAQAEDLQALLAQTGLVIVDTAADGRHLGLAAAAGAAARPAAALGRGHRCSAL